MPTQPHAETLQVLDAQANAVLGPLLETLRCVDLQVDRAHFRRAMRQVGTFLAFEIGKHLETKPCAVETPLGHKQIDLPLEPPVLATALRAGLPFLDGFMDVFPDSDVSFFGASRAESTKPKTASDDLALNVDIGYQSLAVSAGKTMIFVDPMVATGSTILDIYAALKARKQTPARFIVAGLVGYRDTFSRLRQAIPNIEVFFATADDKLNEQNYIVPGLGDAGDLSFGRKS
ncbi:MAG: uracil phosphoribosyltransferase [Planctomycetota bacterium]